MANDEFQPRFGELRLDTDIDHNVTTDSGQDVNPQPTKAGSGYCSSPKQYRSNNTFFQNGSSDNVDYSSQDSPASPIAIPKATGLQKFPSIDSEALSDIHNNSEPYSSIDEFMRNRQTSISFNSKVKLESGEEQSAERPPEKARHKVRGRSVFQAMAEDMARRNQAPGELDHTQADSSSSSPLLSQRNGLNERPTHRAGGGFPILQKTIDDLPPDAVNEPAKSLTSDSTVSPGSEVHTPLDVNQNGYLVSPSSRPARASSYEDFASWVSTKSRQPTTQGFRNPSLSSAPMTRNPSLRSVRHSSRRSTTASNKSPASVFLRAFSTHEDKAPSPDDEGQTIGVDPIYVIGKQIGSGGFSMIKEAVQVPISSKSTERRKLAVKIVRRSIAGKSDSENRAAQAEFDHEVDLWRRLHHPQVLTLEAVYKSDFATFCFIPLNVGGTLFDLVRNNRGGLSDTLSKSLSKQLADALRYLHEDARVAHRDVKLENCLYEPKDSGSGLMRLCDFGMAEWLSSEDIARNDVDRPPQKTMGPADSSSSAFVGGSLEYAAPETLQASKQHQDGHEAASSSNGVPCAIPVNAAVDVWAFGVCVYTMVVGSRPFQNTGFPERTWMDILGCKWDRDRLLSKGGSSVLDLVGRGCLVQDTGRRWEMREVLLSHWLADEDKVGKSFTSFWGL
ncbi:MAG: hypothetical protein Q9160_003460 [Pyrenula sp. 1 TL-2023]